MTRFTRPELESYIRSIDAAAYAKERNHVGHSTRLSEYITRGVIDLPSIRELILERNSASASYKLINELAWREYWQSVWRVKGNKMFETIRPGDREVRNELPLAVLEARTGITELDKGIRELYETGYIHNHMRMWLAGLVCSVARCDWRVGADWMMSHLIDGDYASNHLSWQWCAGTYTGKPYLPQQDNINTYTSTRQTGTFLDAGYDQISDMAIPEVLQETGARTPHAVTLPEATISVTDLSGAKSLSLYSPWTLDSTWHSNDQGTRVLLLETEALNQGGFNQNVIDSIGHFASEIPELKIAHVSTDEIRSLQSDSIRRKDYPGIAHWPGEVDAPELLYSGVPQQFYPSFSAFWKQAQKSA